jgi:uncharacterized membrane protein
VINFGALMKEMVGVSPLPPSQKFAPARRTMRVIMASFYAVAGILHLYAPNAFLPIIPDWVPEARNLILVTGLCEIAGAIALLRRRLRNLAGYMLAAYAICVFPANIKHALYHIHVSGLPDSWWYHAPRLAMQPVVVWWALFSAQCISWPFRSSLQQIKKQ